jgi:hypothetical protein
MLTTDQETKLIKDIEYMQAGKCDITFIAATLQISRDDVRRLIEHRDEMRINESKRVLDRMSESLEVV